MPTEQPTRATSAVTCPHCGQPAELVSGHRLHPDHPKLHGLLFWRCDPCDAHVACHASAALGGLGDGTVPLGSLALPALRHARQRAHHAFDDLFAEPGGTMSRNEAYAWLAAALKMDRTACHIAMMDEGQCAAVVAAVRSARPASAPAVAAGLQASSGWQKAVAAFDEAAIPYTVGADGQHLELRVAGDTVDYWPANGAWSVRSVRERQFGLGKLLEWCRNPVLKRRT